MKKDPNQAAKALLDKLIPQKNPAAMSLGRKGGLKGGKARAAKLTPERRREIAMLGVKARLAKAKQ